MSKANHTSTSPASALSCSYSSVKILNMSRTHQPIPNNHSSLITLTHQESHHHQYHACQPPSTRTASQVKMKTTSNRQSELKYLQPKVCASLSVAVLIQHSVYHVTLLNQNKKMLNKKKGGTRQLWRAQKKKNACLLFAGGRRQANG
ncbi:hypothetical protein HBI23_092440 [Parastagonospora nodorum]|nr:hypothetical protein HBI79_171210 [Parastagonospora nodorum]KAH5434735.1 hypothetical protein HBI47_083990 [Parastagonospora nodorum]KAH5662820.1 hypothetical protein HBI23_092440 [Parastagonospora nodorum]